MTERTLLPFFTDTQIEILGESVAGSCETTTNYLDYWLHEWNLTLTEEEINEVNDHLEEVFNTQLELFRCTECYWWGQQGEPLEELTDGNECCSDCAEEYEED